MPIKLKGVLARHGIRQAEFAAAILQSGGRSAGQPISGPIVTQLLNWGVWPKLTPREDVIRQAEALLHRRGVPEDEIAIIWELDERDEFRNVHPAGVHARPRRNTNPYPDTDTTNNLPEVVMLSATAKKHFRLFKDLFQDDVQGPEDVFLSADQRYIREAMYQTARHGGFLAVVGESGAGKTTLRRDLLDRIARENTPITVIQPQVIDKQQLSAAHIADAIICDISQEPPKRSLEAKARQIQRLLVGSSRAGNNHVLMIEEAHDLSVPTLKYLKRFWELEDGFRKLLAIILIGQPELKNKLDERQNWEAREVIRRCEIAELQPLNGNLEDYLQLKLTRVGKTLEEVFDNDAYDALRARLTIRRRGAEAGISMLYPLVVNNAVTKALNLAAEIGAARVNAEIVRGV